MVYLRRDVVLLDRVSTTGTSGRKKQEIIFSTIRLAVLVMKTFIPEGLSAMVAEKVLRMPRLVQPIKKFKNNIVLENQKIKLLKVLVVLTQ